MRAELHDGTVLEFPDGTDPAIVQATVKRVMGEQGTQNNSLGSQAGLAARSALRGIAGIPSIVTEPIRQLAIDPAYKAFTGRPSGSVSLPALADRFSDAVGLPTPDTPTQRTVDTTVEMGTGAAGMSAAARAAANFLANGTAKTMLGRLGADPALQTATMAGAGGAGQHARENGAGVVGELGSTMLGGLGAAGLLGGARSAVAGAKNLMPQQQQLVQQRVDQRINVALQQNGIDLATVTPAMRTHLREQVRKAMNLGGINEDAVARLADYSRLNMTPTRARLTLDPYDVTQEANASKIAAATGARDARLPAIAQGNNRRLLSLVDDFGGARPADPYGQGSAVTGAIRSQDETLKSGVDALYQRARDSSGRGLPLDGAAFAARANQALDDALLGGKLPEDVARHMNRIANGEVPFTVDYAEQLKTRIGDLQRATNDRSVAMALSMVRRALDDTPLRPAPRVNPRNLPAVPGTVPPSPAAVGQEAIDAFNAARTAARGRFAWQESSPMIGRALDGANADTFVQQNILSRAAGFDHVARAAEVINANPAAREATRTAIVQHLKNAAIGRGGETATGNFSGRGFTAALSDLGDRKLGLFFDADEIATLKSMGRTGSFETFQPRGSAVNNSNTAAGVAGLLQGVGKYVRPVANKLPFGEMAIGAPLDNLTVWSLQRPATNIPRGLLAPSVQPQGSRMDPLLLPGLYGGGLLAPPLSDR